MKKLMTMAVAVLLVSGAAFAGGGKKEGKECCKKEGKSCSKGSKTAQKEKKEAKPAETATAPKG